MTLKSYTKFCFTGLLLTTACTAQEPVNTEPETPPLPVIEIKAPTKLAPILKANLSRYPDRYKKILMRSFDELQKDGEVRSEQIEALMEQQLTLNRGKMIGGILSADKNNDGDLDTNELLSLAMTGRHQGYYNGNKSLPLAQGDRNGDGVFSADEIRSFSNLFVNMDNIISKEPSLSLMAFDTNKNGVLTRAEIEAAMNDIEIEPKKSVSNLNSSFARIAKEIDAGDVNTPTKPAAGLRSRPVKPSDRQMSQQKLRDEACEPKLKIPKNAKFLLLSGYEGNALSTVMVADKFTDTEVTQVIIEDGDDPLYIIAGAYTPMIWSIEGDIGRVSAFIATKARRASKNGAGVMGLPANKVDFIADSCMGYLSEKRSKEAILAKARFERIYDRPVDYAVTGYTLDSVTLPSGEMLGKSRRQAREELEKETGAKRTEVAKGLSFSSAKNYEPARKTSLYRFFKDGIAYVDPKHVISPSPLSPYDVHPGEAGLAQLLETGHIESIERNTYYIKKTFPHFPSGLAGAHQVSFILGKGVARPAGTPGHSSLIDEATGTCLTRSCR